LSAQRQHHLLDSLRIALTSNGVLSTPTERVPLRSWLAVVAVAVGTFLVVTVENP
jgi:hypothetical protein